jgi:hypothetical protein
VEELLVAILLMGQAETIQYLIQLQPTVALVVAVTTQMVLRVAQAAAAAQLQLAISQAALQRRVVLVALLAMDLLVVIHLIRQALIRLRVAVVLVLLVERLPQILTHLVQVVLVGLLLSLVRL